MKLKELYDGKNVDASVDAASRKSDGTESKDEVERKLKQQQKLPNVAFSSNLNAPTPMKPRG